MKKNVKFRDSSIDFIKAIAVLLMVFTHFYVLTNMSVNLFPISTFLEKIADCFCFPAFIFAYGASYYFSFNRKGKEKLTKLLLRIFTLYSIFIVLTLFFFFDQGIDINVKNILDYTLLIKYPFFGEFIISFLFLEIIFFVFGPKLFNFSKKISNLIFGFIAIFILSILFVRLNIPPINVQHHFLNIFIFGDNQYFIFPILHFLLISLFGVNFAQNGGIDGINYKKLNELLIFSAIIFIIFVNFSSSITYLEENLIIIILLLIFYKIFKSKIESNIFLINLINSLSRYLILIYPLHLIIGYILKKNYYNSNPILPYDLTAFFVLLILFIYKLRYKKSKFKIIK